MRVPTPPTHAEQAAAHVFTKAGALKKLSRRLYRQRITHAPSERVQGGSARLVLQAAARSRLAPLSARRGAASPAARLQ
jgi:hypothetical protein